MVGTHGILKLELEVAEFEDSGDISNKIDSLTIGTPLMPYTEPSFENEGKVEQFIDEDKGHMSLGTVNSKKRSRHVFEAANSRKPLMYPTDHIESLEVGLTNKSKLSNRVLIKTTSNYNLSQRRVVLLK